MNEDLVNELRRIAKYAPLDPEYKVVGLAAEVIERISPCAEQFTTMARLLKAAEQEIEQLRERERRITKARALSSNFNANNFVAVGAAGVVSAGQLAYGSTTATSATAGSNGDVPAQVVGYIIANVGGTTAKIPYYAN